MNAHNVHEIMLSDEPRVDMNIEFLEWLYDKVKKGYLPSLLVEEMSEFVRRIATWYEFKYTKEQLLADEAPDDLVYTMSLEALKTRLTPKEEIAFTCPYRQGNGFDFDSHTISFYIEDSKGNIHRLVARKTDGCLIGDLGIFTYLSDPTKPLYVEELLDILSDYPNYDLTNLRRIVTTHERDLQLRDALFKLVAMNLNNSKCDLNEKTRTLRVSRWLQEISAHLGINIDIDQNFTESDDSLLSIKEAKRLREKIMLQTIENCRSNK